MLCCLSSKGVKFLIKELLYTHIATRLLPTVLASANLLPLWKRWIKVMICQLLYLFLCQFYLKCLLWVFLAALDTFLIGKQVVLCISYMLVCSLNAVAVQSKTHK